jgi:hypothetical protein
MFWAIFSFVGLPLNFMSEMNLIPSPPGIHPR